MIATAGRGTTRVACLFLLALASCQAAPDAPPSAESPSGAALSSLSPEMVARIDAIFAPWDRADSPGCAIGVYRGGEIVFARGYGSANLEHGVPIGPDTVFDLGSVSKHFTAACIALLEIEGELSVDDRIRRHIPELPECYEPVTVRHLLHHTSGAPDYVVPLVEAGHGIADVTTVEQALEVLRGSSALLFPPGERHVYSNSGYFLLSLVVERASGETLARFAARRFFAPLGMTRTHFHGDHTEIVPGRATAYARRDAGGFAIAMSQWEQTGDGSVMTTVRDLCRWERNLSTGEVGGPAFLERMARRGRLASGEELRYGMGLVHGVHGGRPCVEHGGAWAGYRAALVRFPGEELGIACLANLADVDPRALAREVTDLLIAEPAAPAEVRGSQRAGAPKGLAPVGGARGSWENRDTPWR